MWKAVANIPRLSGNYCTINPILLEESAQKFLQASNAVMDAQSLIGEKPSVDAYLKYGGLNCRDCASAIKTCTGHDLIPKQIDRPIYVTYQVAKEMFENWKGDRNIEKWAILSAYAFLETCVEQKCGFYTISYND